jgi:hypothetical protein
MDRPSPPNRHAPNSEQHLVPLLERWKYFSIFMDYMGIRSINAGRQ